ncbi:MAG: PQQ-binding-like beta-propeller repeat protein [Alphaproteobacteria bacterium]|nr:PQQ-binding-like beta-propeller repeat protein [Alphaproteobacteria bacterium]
MSLPGDPIAAARFSTLDEITTENVGGLSSAYSVALPIGCGYSGAPQQSGDLLIVVTPFPHRVLAVDLASGTVRWNYAPPANSAAKGSNIDCRGSQGPTVSGDAVFLNTLDGHTISLAAASGSVNWDMQSADLEAGEPLGAAPVVVNGAVLVGNAGEAFGVRGWIKSLDRSTGRELWRKYSTGSDSEVGINAGFHPVYKTEQGHDLGVSSWPPAGWEHGGGNVAGMIASDPETGLIFHGTGRPAPGNPDRRAGDNKWTSGLFARDPQTGMARWFTQLTPHDPYGYGATAANVLADRDWKGSSRHLLVHADANAYVYVLDRDSGEILSAAPFAPANAIDAVDPKSGAPHYVEAKAVRGDDTTRNVCPAATGALSGGAPALSGDARLLFIPATLLCMDIRPHDVSYLKNTPYTGVAQRLRPGPSPNRGALSAWDIERGKPAWIVPERFPVESGVLATAGNLVFYGTLDGWLRAVDAGTGRMVWQYRAASQVAGQPVTGRGPDGKQYIAVLAGLAGPAGRSAADEIDTLDRTAAQGFANAIPDLPHPPDAHGMLYVFKLP